MIRQKLQRVLCSTLSAVSLTLIVSLYSPVVCAETYRWSTNWGNMTVSSSDNVTFRGTYDGAPDGRVWGKYNESTRTFRGLWYQSKSDKRCGSPRTAPNGNKTWYWGKLRYNLNADETSFTGAWGYCRNNPSESWTGRLK